MGHIEKRGSSYRLHVSCGYDSKGKKKYKRKTVNLSHLTAHKQEIEARRLLALFENEVLQGSILDGNKITFEEFITLWINDHARIKLEPKTLFSYQSELEKRIIPALGHIKLSRLTPNHLIQFYNNLREEGVRLDYKYRAKANFFEILKKNNYSEQSLMELSSINRKNLKKIRDRENMNPSIAEKISEGLQIPISKLFEKIESKKRLSDRTIQLNQRIISSILTTAVHWQFIVSNPALRVQPQKVERKEASHFDLEQTEYLLQLMNEEPLKYRTMVYITVFGGLRLGELNALEWKDIDWDTNSVSISKALQYLPNKGVFIKKPKNSTSKRKIMLPASVMKILREYKVWQNSNKVTLDNLWNESDYVFTQDDGTIIFPDTISKWFSKFISSHNSSIEQGSILEEKKKKKLLLPKVSFHGLRHTNATLLMSQNIDLATVSKRLGHANITTTLNIYTHTLEKLDQTASDSLESLFSKDKKTVQKKI
ncbi:tyrosine recombinase XerC [Proteiniclasticum sp. C24MP]|uniref:site-specific integrase n=1 Tax=Proteiniclasticum sp. C24MP TaxID=3374101 RepID=UPI00375507A2